MIHLYTGTGKGKTTAALGLAVRAAGAGLRVYIAQFCKGRPSSELRALRKHSSIRVDRFGKARFIKGRPSPSDIEEALRGFRNVQRLVKSGVYDVIILDEICIAIYFKLISEKEILAIMKAFPKGRELILTGQKASRALVRAADLVTEMKERKHYYKRGVSARKGIDW